MALLALSASVSLSTPASAAPALVDGCSNTVYLVPAGTAVTADYAACRADVGQPQVDVYDATGNWLGMETPTGSLPSVSFTTRDTFHDLYAMTTVTQTSPFTTQIHAFFFTCGTDPVTYTTQVMDPSYNSGYVTFSSTMPTLDLCSASASGDGPAPIVQQFGNPASGTCDVAAPQGLVVNGVREGGWSKSWSQWINGGKGGDVCTRTLVYSASQGAWIVG